MLSIRPVVVHPTHIFWIFPRRLFSQTNQSPRIQVRVVPISQNYPHVTYCSVDDLLWSGRSWCAITKRVLWLLFTLLEFFLGIFFLLISLLDKVVLTHWLDDCSWCVQEFACISICDNVLHNLFLKTRDKTCRKCLVSDLWIWLGWLFLWQYNDWVEVLFLLSIVLFKYLDRLLIGEFC